MYKALDYKLETLNVTIRYSHIGLDHGTLDAIGTFR